jgi:hypothetical protein
MTRTIRIVERVLAGPRWVYEVFEEVECADGRIFTRDIGPVFDRDTALALARYCAEDDPDLVLPSAEVVPFSRCRRRA